MFNSIFPLVQKKPPEAWFFTWACLLLEISKWLEIVRRLNVKEVALYQVTLRWVCRMAIFATVSEIFWNNRKCRLLQCNWRQIIAARPVPFRSPNFNFLDYFLSGYLKQTHKLPTIDNIYKTCIAAVINNFNPNVLQNVRRNSCRGITKRMQISIDGK